jgi:2-polyprenyl-3-methyl-5-hydroxy-6-metoxy-1,4-benzoquinol methylase
MDAEESPTDVMKEDLAYEEFYEQLGKSYPETELVHADKRIGSRYWTVLNELRPFASDARILIDIGCNDGVYTIPYCAAGGKATGIDISQSLVDKGNAKARMLKLPCSFLQGDIDSPHLRDTIGQAFEVALFSEVLEHVRNPTRALSTVRSLLTYGGHMILTTPTPLFNGMDSKWKYPITMFAGKKLLESHVVDTREIPVLMRYGIASSQYRHDGYYPIALTRYVEDFGFALVRSYTVGFPRKVRQALFLMGMMGRDSEMIIRRVPVLNLLGVTNVTVFRAV